MATTSLFTSPMFNLTTTTIATLSLLEAGADPGGRLARPPPLSGAEASQRPCRVLLFVKDGKAAISASLKGGETEALERLKKFAAECHAQPKTDSKDGSRDSIYGANFSCKISPWLATGCLSPRFMFDELKKSATRTISAATQKNGASPGDNGMNWLMFELLWRDFFRFITKKYSSNERKTEAVPATAYTGALA